MKNYFSLAFLLSFIMGGAGFALASGVDTEIHAIADNLRRNTLAVNDYGATQHVVTTRLTPDGDIKRIEEKRFRTLWSGDHSTKVLMDVHCTDYESPVRNSRECVEFTKSASAKSMKPGKFDSEIKKIRWLELYKNFDFQMLPSENGFQVLSFRPKADRIDTENKLEKILTQLTGKVWVDRNFNIVKAEAHLLDPVSFGLGLAAKVNTVTVQYEQQCYKDVWLPAHLNLEFSAKVALVHTERQRIEVTWKDPFRQSEGTWAQVGAAATDVSLTEK